MRLVIILIMFVFTELSLLLYAARFLGVLNTVIVIFVTGAVGFYFAKSQGFSLLVKFKNDFKRGITPADAVAEGLFIFIGALLLMVPGFLTDIIGLLFIIPYTRGLFKKAFNKRYKDRIKDIIENKRRGVSDR